MRLVNEPSGFQGQGRWVVARLRAPAMRRLGLLLAPSWLLVAGVAGAQAVPPPAPPPPPPPVTGGCSKDTDCKGDRICVQAQCVNPTAKPPAPAPTPETTAPPPPPAPPAPPAATAEPAPPPPAPPEWTPRGARDFTNESRVASGARGAQEPTSAWERAGLSGLEVEVRGGFMLPDGASPVLAPGLYASSMATGNPTGDILRGTERPYGLEPFGLVASVGYRFLPWLSVGAFFSYASFSALDGTDSGDYPDTTSQLQRQMWTLGAYGRYYFTRLHRRLHPWVELGLGYSDDNASYTRGSTQASNGQPETAEYYLEEKGIVARLVAGLDWRLAPVFSVGPWLGYERVVPVSGCAEVVVDSASPVPGIANTCSSPVEANGYGVVSGGIFVKLTLNPWAR